MSRLLNMITDIVLLCFWARAPKELSAIEIILLLLLLVLLLLLEGARASTGLWVEVSSE